MKDGVITNNFFKGYIKASKLFSKFLCMKKVLLMSSCSFQKTQVSYDTRLLLQIANYSRLGVRHFYLLLSVCLKLNTVKFEVFLAFQIN